MRTKMLSLSATNHRPGLERALWLTACLALALLVVHLRNEMAEFKATFLTGEPQKDLAAAALKHFAKANGASHDEVRDTFHLSYADFSDRDCIRFVPKKHVTGGATTYCFVIGRPVRLLSIDKGSE